MRIENTKRDSHKNEPEAHGSRMFDWCHVESGTIFGEGTIPEPSTPHIGKGVALVAQAAAPVYPRVYRRSTISDSTNDHSSFYATVMSPVCTTAVRAMSPA